ncbi:hypothetical protein GW17_00051987 [Ensete ventricosum]|nr:hypothetical protein GW17_00051987 [Ensete ventricosum]
MDEWYICSVIQPGVLLQAADRIYGLLACRIVEGSEDGGSSWNVLDEQNSQIFERRFQRKTFTVKKKCMSKAFRYIIFKASCSSI